MQFTTHNSRCKVLLFVSLQALSCLIPLNNSKFPELATNSVLPEQLIGCTTGIACGAVTPDGRPLLWKTRDVGNGNQEYHYVDDGRIPFIGLCYANEDGFRYYAGVNAAGFAVENSNSYNLPEGGGGWDTFGNMQAHMLATCRTVDDLEHLLDSTNATGRSFNYNYGTFDAFGDAAMFEVACSSYVRIDAAETQEGFIVRSNYSYSGDDLNNRAEYWGPNRHDRAYTLFNQAVENEELTPKYIFQKVARNLAAEGMDDYNLPYNNYFEDLPFGMIPLEGTICRSTSRSVMVAQGILPNERPDLTTLWAMVGNPAGCIASPMWVRAGSVPLEYNGQSGSEICKYSMNRYDWITKTQNFETCIESWKLHNTEGTGIWDWSFAIENTIFDRVETYFQSDDFSLDMLENFQILLARQVSDSLENWLPPYYEVEVFEPVFWNNHVLIYWTPPEEIDIGTEIRHPPIYSVFKSLEPFINENKGELIVQTEETIFTDLDSPAGSAFYRVEAVFP